MHIKISREKLDMFTQWDFFFLIYKKYRRVISLSCENWRFTIFQLEFWSENWRFFVDILCVHRFIIKVHFLLLVCFYRLSLY